MMNPEELKRRVEELRTSGGFDLSTEEDLAIGVMHLVNLEEHLYFTGKKTEKDEYFDLLDRVRSMRKELLEKMIPRHEGETWCTCKHLLGATMRMFEVGTKLHGDGNKDDAKQYYDKAYELFSMFWAIRLKLVDMSEVKAMVDEEKPMTLKDITTKLVDCCDE